VAPQSGREEWSETPRQRAGLRVSVDPGQAKPGLVCAAWVLPGGGGNAGRTRPTSPWDSTSNNSGRKGAATASTQSVTDRSVMERGVKFLP